MTTKEVAKRFEELCKTGDFKKTQEELFSEDVVSIEPNASDGFEKETKGKKAVEKKGEQWESMVEEMHDFEMSEVIVANESFACRMRMKVTMKGKGEMDMTELCVYKVKDGKIVSEEFFM